MNIMGIDVGMNGGLALYDGEELLVWSMPTHQRSKTNRLDGHEIKRIVTAYKLDHAYIEQVNAFGMGVSSAYNFGFGCGVIEGVLAACDVPFTYVTPQKWKKELSVPANKDAARMRASQLLPKFAHTWQRKKDDGLAEAALIALYGFGR